MANGPRGRLLDFSYAGYRAGEAAVPEVPVMADVRNFGAIGDRVADDSAAVQKAVAAVAERGGGAVLFPAGMYRITALLQGAGARSIPMARKERIWRRIMNDRR